MTALEGIVERHWAESWSSLKGGESDESQIGEEVDSRESMPSSRQMVDRAEILAIKESTRCRRRLQMYEEASLSMQYEILVYSLTMI